MEGNYLRGNGIKVELPDQIVIKRKILKLVGARFHIQTTDGRDLYTADQKGFKLREDIRIKQGDQEVIGIHARKIMDFSSAYDVLDLTDVPNATIGVLKRRGLKSMLRDEWEVADAQEQPVGLLTEDSMALALVRRILTNLIPQNYDLMVGSEQIVDFKQNFNPFSYHLNISFKVPNERFDRRLGLAAGILLAAVEGRQG